MKKKSGIFRFKHADSRRKIFTIFLLTFGFASYGEGAFDFSDAKISANTGLKIFSPHAEFRSYTTLPKTSFSEISSTQGIKEKLELFDEWRLGAGLSLFKESFPLTLKAGHNSYSKSLSRLKNPSPSVTGNPLSKSFAFSTGTGSALPSLTSSRQPLSCSISLSPGEKLFPIQICLEGFFNEDRESAVCFSAKHSLSKSAFVQSTFSAGRFYIENNSQILEKNNASFKPDFFVAALGEFCFHSPLLKINFYSGIQESPYAENPFWFKIDGRTAFRSILLNFSYFAIPNSKDCPKVAPLIGGSSSICRIVEQASVNPQILFLYGEKSLRLGFCALENWKVTSTNEAVQLNTAKFRAGGEYKDRNFSSRLDWTRANLLISGTPPSSSAIPEEYQSISLTSSIALEKARFSLSGSWTNYPPKTEKSSEKDVLSADFKVAVPKLNLTGSTGVKVTYKDGSRSAGEIDGGISYFLNLKHLRSCFKIAFYLPF